MKQLIIARKDLNMSPGKLAAQVSHASMAFLSNAIRTNSKQVYNCEVLPTWELKLINKTDVEKRKQFIEKLTEEAKKYNPDFESHEEIVELNGKWYIKRPQWYKRGDLYDWAVEARENGKSFFYVEPIDKNDPYGPLRLCEPTYHIESTISIDKDTWDNWIYGSFTKIVCEAKNRSQLYKAATIADSLNLKENEDYFIIRDNCLTELTPEDPDGRTPTCIGFKPLSEEIVNQISHKFQLYK